MQLIWSANMMRTNRPKSNARKMLMLAMKAVDLSKKRSQALSRQPQPFMAMRIIAWKLPRNVYMRNNRKCF